MESILKIIFGGLFTLGAICFWSAVGLWIAAAFHLVPEARKRWRWNPLIGTFSRDNLTERGQLLRTWFIRCAVAAVTFGMIWMALLIAVAMLIWLPEGTV